MIFFNMTTMATKSNASYSHDKLQTNPHVLIYVGVWNHLNTTILIIIGEVNISISQNTTGVKNGVINSICLNVSFKRKTRNEYEMNP